MKWLAGTVASLSALIEIAGAVPIVTSTTLLVDSDRVGDPILVDGIAINDAGDLAFLTANEFGRRTLHALEAGVLRQVSTATATVQIGLAVDINNLGQIAFFEQSGSFSDLIVDANGARQVLIDDNGPFSSLPANSRRNFSINDNGAVGFQVSGAGGLRPAIVDDNGVRPLSLPSEFTLSLQPSLNNADEFAVAVNSPGGDRATSLAFISEDDFQVVAPLPTAGEFLVALRQNNLGDVALTFQSDDGVQRLAVFSGGLITNLPVSPSDVTIGSAFAINDFGDILFTGLDEDGFGLESLHIFADGGYVTIAEVGQTLDAKVIASLLVGTNSLTNEREVAFWVQFTDLTTAIYKSSYAATSEIPIPPAIALFGLGLVAFGATARRRRD